MTMTLMMPSLWRASTVQNTGPQLVPLAGANATWTLDGSVILSRNVLGSKCRRRTGLQPGDGGRLFSQESRMPNGAPVPPRNHLSTGGMCELGRYDGETGLVRQGA
ncbi:hypothetical protein BJ912DRAFT_1056280 [Pholiota molesta]|nr:hypothetical protein BJ912DRAFT_1056280 [Pholiota molesta]